MKTVAIDHQVTLDSDRDVVKLGKPSTFPRKHRQYHGVHVVVLNELSNPLQEMHNYI